MLKKSVRAALLVAAAVAVTAQPIAAGATEADVTADSAITADSAMATAVADQYGCVKTVIAGAPYPGGQVTCPIGRPAYVIVLLCKKGPFDSRWTSYSGSRYVNAPGKSIAYCTASYPAVYQIQYNFAGPPVAPAN
ncbi:hypothetical protein OG394_30125 [Kribbella sp. NBC_01245]|uniref:hypothetical protein n=1 Tax=Kribbella sp. NBC_01245 TaxID=2903578 RepID=UPI002E284376|nr:hypothetical protein [Kribbella sp. NBC_01245]